MIGQINNEKFIGFSSREVARKITGHGTKLKQDLLIN